MQYEMKPRGTMELVDAAFQLYRNHFATFFTVTAAVMAPQLVINLNIFHAYTGVWRMPDAEVMTKNMQGSMQAFSGYFLVTFLGYMVLQAVLVHTACEVYNGRAPTPLDAFRGAAPRIFYAAASNCLCATGMTLGFFFFIIPGAWLSVVWAFSAQAVMFEKKSPWASLKRSAELTKGLRPFVGTYLLVITVLVYAIGMGCNMVFAASLKQMPLTQGILQAMPAMFVTPLYAIVLTVGYFDARIRKEAYDLETASSS